MVANKVYVIGVGMSKFIKPRGEIDYPGKNISISHLYYFIHAIFLIFIRICIGGLCQGLERCWR
jgi:hypothetical protein